MSSPPDKLLGTPDPVPCLPLATLVASSIAALGYPGRVLHLDCSAPPYSHSLGMCHQLSQLLRLRHAGVCISLHRVHPLLRRYLYLLKVEHLFTWAV